ncbi:uncharacterized protein METZ01_LOCUS172923 [marine metagenome]|uniref:Uncharacterized protein n=1 Tax=marine metagenome TaxID=408172 RepID=A0A382C2I8_9ZZZZ
MSKLENMVTRQSLKHFPVSLVQNDCPSTEAR